MSEKAICVFLGSAFGLGQEYLSATKILGKELARKHVTLIYGGGRLGLMGVLADEVLRNGGKVIGVITKHLLDSEGYQGLSKMYVVDTMQERKLLMAQLSDACIALPGGLGTLEEIFEFWNASKLGLYQKPVGLLNVNNYYKKLLEFIKSCIDQNFINRSHLNLIISDPDPLNLINALIKENEVNLKEKISPVRLFA